MKNPVCEQIQARKVKSEGHAEHAAACSAHQWRRQPDLPVFRSIAALCYIWRERYEKHGVAGLRDLPRRPHNIRFRIPPEIFR